LEKFIYSDMYRCVKCGYRVGIAYALLRSNLTFVCSRHTRCIRCGTIEVRRSSRRDRIDSVSNNPLSWLMRFAAAPINRCVRCRLQYFDWRHPVRRPSAGESEIRATGEFRATGTD
jgi:hypothetical protein